MKKFLVVFLAACLALLPLCLTAGAAESAFYLGDHPELVKSFSGLEDKLGFNTAHSGDVLTVGGVKFDKGFGLHCNPAGTETYIEIDISGQNYTYFTAQVGVQSYSKDGVFLDWGSIAFCVYGDGQLLAKTDTCVYGKNPVMLSCSVQGVKTLRLVQDCVDGHSCDWGAWGDAKLTNTKPEEETMPEPEFTPDKTNIRTPDDIIAGDFTYVSDMYWLDCKSYPNTSIMRDANTVNEWIMDSTFRLFDKGIGMHGSSDGYTSYVEVNIADMGYTKFASYYGICMTMSQYDISMAACRFAVFGDGNKLFESGVMTYNQPMEYMECDVSGVSTLKIAIAGAPGISGCWGTWGGAVLIRTGNGADILAEKEEAATRFTEDTEEPTAAPVTEPATEPTTEPAPESATDTDTEPVTAVQTEPDTDTDTTAETETETEGQAGGCASSVTMLSATIVLGGALLLRRKRNDA